MKLFSLLSIISLPFVFVLADDKPEIEEGRLFFRLTHNVILFF